MRYLEEIYDVCLQSIKIFSGPGLDGRMEDENGPWVGARHQVQTFFFDIFQPHEFRWWICTLWCVMCLDSRQSFF